MHGSGSVVGWLARNSVAAFMVYGAGAALTYCSQLMIARLAGADAYGIYAYVFAWMTVLAYVSALGFDVSLLRFVPGYRVAQAWALLRGVIRYAERRTLTVGGGVALVGVLLVMMLGRRFPPQLTVTFIIGFVLVPVWARLWIRCAVVRAFGGVVSALGPDRVVRDGLLLVLVAAAGWGMGWKLGAPFAMLATVLSSGVGLALVSLAVRRRRPGAVAAAVPEYARATWRRTAMPLVLIAVGETLMNRTGVLLLGCIGHTRDAGIYALAFNIAFVVVLPRTAVNALLAPMISELYIRNDRAGLQALITKTTSWTLLSVACMAVPLWFVAGDILARFGHDFAGGTLTLRVLLIGQVVAAGAGSQLFIMTMTGHERSAAVRLLLSAIANAVLSAALIQPAGLVGAAVAATATLILWNYAMSLFIWRRLRLLPGALAMLRLPFEQGGHFRPPFGAAE